MLSGENVFEWTKKSLLFGFIPKGNPLYFSIYPKLYLPQNLTLTSFGSWELLKQLIMSHLSTWQYFGIKLGFPPSNSIDIHVTDLIFVLFLIFCTLYTHVSLLCKWFELINVFVVVVVVVVVVVRTVPENSINVNGFWWFISILKWVDQYTSFR